MQIVEKPTLLAVPQLAQTQFPGSLANFLSFFSAGVRDMISSGTLWYSYGKSKLFFVKGYQPTT